MALKPNSGLDRLIVEGSTHIAHRHALPVRLLLTSDQLVAEAATYTPRQEDCALLGSYAACNGNFLPTFRDNQSVPSSRTIDYPEPAVSNYK